MANPKLYAGSNETIKDHILDLNFLPYKKISNAKGYTMIDIAAFATCTLLRFTDFMVMETRSGEKVLNVVGISYQNIDSVYTVQNTDDGSINLVSMSCGDYFPEDAIKDERLKWQELDPVKAGFIPADAPEDEEESDDDDDEDSEEEAEDEETESEEVIPDDDENDYPEDEESDEYQAMFDEVDAMIPDSCVDEEIFEENDSSDEEDAKVEEMVKQEDAEEEKKEAASKELSAQIDKIAKEIENKSKETENKSEPKDWKKDGVSPKKTHLGDEDKPKQQNLPQKKPHYDKRSGKPASGKVNFNNRNQNQKNKYQSNKNNQRRNRNNTTPKTMPNMMDMDLMRKLLSEN